MKAFSERLDVHLPTDQDASGRSLGEAELSNLAEVVTSGILNSTKGRFVSELQTKFAEKLGVKYAFACASGTAAVHAAVAALDPEPGDEVVTSPITDMGALTPILYQGAIPRFADVDPRTWNLTASSIKQALNERTRAIIVTHLFGNPCDMDEILALGQANGLPVIEDCAQAFLARHRDRFVGAIGRIGCFSLQQGKHITCGEGGIIVTNDDHLAHRIELFINKAWGYGEANPDHEFLALNYRMSELQGAVAAAQLFRLEKCIEKRVFAANELSRRLDGLPGIEVPYVYPFCVHTYWKYCLRMKSDTIPGGCDALGKALKARSIYCVPRYIQKPAFLSKIFQEQKTFGNSRFPFTLAQPEALQYDRTQYPLTYEALENILVLPWNENYRTEHIEFIAGAIHDAISEIRR